MRAMNVILFLLLFSFSNLYAQRYAGVSESDYSGIHGMKINPANIVNPHYKVDFELLSWNFSLVNDYLSFSIDSLVNGTGDFFKRFKNKNKSEYANIAFDSEYNWFNGLVSINDKMSIGFGIKSRTLIHARGFNKNLIEMSASGLNDATFYGKSYTDNVSSLGAMSWNEYAVSFGSEVYNEGEHYLKVGGTLKLLQSVGSIYLHTKDLSYEFYNADTIVNCSGLISFGSTNPNVPFSTTNLLFPYGSFAGGNFGFGADVGVIYEWRPNGDEKYKLKAGLSFQDMGFVPFIRNPIVSNDVTFNNATLDVNIFDGVTNLDDINSIVYTDTAQFHSEYNIYYDSVGGVSDAYGKFVYNMQTPTKMNLFADYHVAKGFHVSFFSAISLYSKNNAKRVVGINSFELTPRYDFKWIGFALPISYVQNSGFNLGLGLRLGPVHLGSSNLIDLFQMGNKVSKFNFYFGFRIPIFKKSE